MIRTIENIWMKRPALQLPVFKINRKPSAKAVTRTTLEKPKEMTDYIAFNLKMKPEEIGTGAKQVQNRMKGKVFDIKV